MRCVIGKQGWARREAAELFCFHSFDEPWKLGHQGQVDSRCGQWDKDEQPKYRPIWPSPGWLAGHRPLCNPVALAR